MGWVQRVCKASSVMVSNDVCATGVRVFDTGADHWTWLVSGEINIGGR